ncbi:MAG TPA: signal peptidase I [Armatimonadota bacterium]|jgi:signal peptidase I
MTRIPGPNRPLHTGRRNRRHAVTGGLASVLLGFGLFYQPVVVQGQSMAPSLKDGQVIWMGRQSLRRHAFRRGDIVIFRHDSNVYVKRVYARGGEVVTVANMSTGMVDLMDDMAAPNQLAAALRRHPRLGYINLVRVPTGQLFVVGDNRANSMDSRDFGPIEERTVIGFAERPVSGLPLKRVAWGAAAP